MEDGNKHGYKERERLKEKEKERGRERERKLGDNYVLTRQR